LLESWVTIGLQKSGAFNFRRLFIRVWRTTENRVSLFYPEKQGEAHCS